MAYPAPPHIVRSLSPITELTTPASARSIPLPPVGQAYDYKDESPVRPNTNHHNDHADAGGGDGDDDDSDGDGASTYSAGSGRTVVPTSAEPSPVVVSPSSAHVQDTALPSPPLTVRPFPSPTASLPPPPRNISTRNDSPGRSSTPQLSSLRLHHQPEEEEPSWLPYDRSPLEPSPQESHARESDDEDADRASVSTAGMAGIGASRWEDAIREKKARPKSLHTSRPPPLSPIASAQPSRHASLVNIANLPLNAESPINLNDAVTKLRDDKSSSSTLSPQRSKPPSPKSRPASPKSRPSTLKKRPSSYTTPRPASWHSQKPVKPPKKNDKSKAKVKGKVQEVEGSGSSNDDQSETIRSPPLPRAMSTSPRKRIPSILLSLFDPASARQSRGASFVSSPVGSDHPNTPTSPLTPSLNTLEDPEWSALQPAPREAIRTSGTFGIRDDGSVHLLKNEDDNTHGVPRTSTSSRPSRARRDSDNGTVKSGTLGRVLYAVNNRDSLDQTDENATETEHYHDQQQRSLTPFQLENPTSPLESVLSGGRTSEELVRPERKSVDAPHNLMVTAGRSDTSHRAQSPSTELASGASTSNVTVATQGSPIQVMMVDESTQTSLPPSPIFRRPLPRPPSTATATKGKHPQSLNSHRTPTRSKSRPQSLPPPPLSATGAQARPDEPQTDGRAPELPLLIASHLLSTHAATLMRQSTGLVENAEALKRMADESIQWGAMLLSMASKTGTPPRPGDVPSVPLGMTRPAHSANADATANSTIEPKQAYTNMPHSMLYPSTPVFHPPATSHSTPERDAYCQHAHASEPPKTSVESDRYTRLPPRTSRISSHSRRQSYTRDQRPPSADVDHDRDPFDSLPPRQPMTAPIADGIPTDIYRDLSHIRRRESNGPSPNDGLRTRQPMTAPVAERVSTEFYRDVNQIGQRGWEELHKAEDVWHQGMQDLRSFLDTGPDTVSSEHGNENDGRRSSSDHHHHHYQQQQLQPQGEEVLNKPTRTSYSSTRRVSLRRGSSNVSAVRTDESFLPLSGDLKDPSSGTRTDESFLPQSADLVTPIDDSTVRPRPTVRTRPTLSPQLSMMTDSIYRKGYEPAQIHTLLHDDPTEMFGTPQFSPPSPAPPMSAISASTSTIGRKLRKRASAASDKLRQASSGGGSAGGGSTIKASGKKRHWWSRRSRVSGSDDLQEPVTAI